MISYNGPSLMLPLSEAHYSLYGCGSGGGKWGRATYIIKFESFLIINKAFTIKIRSSLVETVTDVDLKRMLSAMTSKWF